MAKSMKKVISVFLALVLVVGTFAGCGKSNKSNKEETAAITATAVKYTKSGQYTTTVSSKNVDLSGITADNVEVRYFDPTADPEATESESTEVATEATTETTEEFKLEDFYPLSAKVESVKAADKKSYEITFTDDKAAELITDSYIVLFKGVEGDDNTASVEVEFPEITLTPDVENVVSDATQAKVTLAIDGSTFEEGISEKDIYLDNAFSDMKIESVSSSDKNLTVQLKGSPVRNEAGAYQWGAIKVKPSGIKDGYADVTSKVDIQLATVNIDAATLKFENGKINADLKVYGIVDINTLTKDNIKIDSATVEAAEKADENTVKLTISADGVKSVNDFADLFGGKAMTLGDYETTVSVSQASFYPVFDYVEADGDNLKLTLKLYANSGTFDKDIKAEAISFADDFKDAKAESVTVDSDTVATLILSVPANGQTTETMSLNGTVTLAADALTNVWGDKTSNDTSYTRDYSGESLGRDVTLNTETLQEIAKYTQGKDTLFGQICSWGSTAGTVFSIAKSVLEFTGILKSEHQQEMEALAEINSKVDNVIQLQYAIMDELSKLEDKTIQVQLEPYKKSVEDLRTAINAFSKDFEYGAVYMALEDAVKAGELDAMPSFAGITDTDELNKKIQYYKELYAPNMDEMSVEEARAYNVRLVKWIKNNMDNVDEYGNSFADFTKHYEAVYSAANDIAQRLQRTDGTSPIELYDEACAKHYNFDSQCYDFRFSIRETAKVLLAKGLGLVAYYNMVETSPTNSTFIELKNLVVDATKRIDALSNIGHPASELDSYIRLEEVEIDAKYISEIKLARDTKSAEAAKKLLTDEGYTVLDIDLNEGVSGYFTYLGYKTTDNYNDAIKDLAFSSGDSPVPMQRWNPTTKKNIPLTLVPYVGDDVFVAAQGGINAGLTNNNDSYFPVYIYYTKEELPDDKKAVVNLFTDNTYQGHENSAPFNLNPFGSEDIRLIYDRAEKPGKIKSLQPKGKNPEYYPYSYVFNKKIAFSDTTALSDYKYFTSPIMAGSGRFGRNWSDDESREFISRMQYSTLAEELKSAGMDISYALLLSISSKSGNLRVNQYASGVYYDYSGINIEIGQKKTSNADLGRSFIYRSEPDSRLADTKNKDVTTIILYD